MPLTPPFLKGETGGFIGIGTFQRLTIFLMIGINKKL